MDSATLSPYDTDFSPNPVILQQAKEPAHPVLPRRVQHRAAPKTRRERIPLLSSLAGPGRAGTETTLVGSSGSKYVGQVLAGRPNGVGQYWVQGTQPGQPLQLVYEGDFVRGVRQGQGTAYYSNRGEVYTGSWVDGKRTGPGKLTYADGCVYEGMMARDVRHGVGTLHSPHTGSIFVGTYVQDKRQGLGVTYWAGRCQKLVAEYVDDTPTCGAMMDLGDDTAEAPASQQLRDAIAAARVQAAGAAAAGAVKVAELPQLGLLQPSRVLASEFGAVRQVREKQQAAVAGSQAAAGSGAAIEAGSGTLAANTISLLRHAFILIAGGNDLAAHVLPHQLQELVVLAGLDPAAPAVLKLLGLLHTRSGERGGHRLSLDDLLEVAAFYREVPLAVVLQQQQQQQCQGAQEELRQEQQQQEEGEHGDGSPAAEVWVEEEAPPLSADSSSAEQAADWGGGNGQDMLAQHIALHRPPAPLPPAQECV